MFITRILVLGSERVKKVSIRVLSLCANHQKKIIISVFREPVVQCLFAVGQKINQGIGKILLPPFLLKHGYSQERLEVWESGLTVKDSKSLSFLLWTESLFFYTKFNSHFRERDYRNRIYCINFKWNDVSFCF